MVTASLPAALRDWREAPRVRSLNGRLPNRDGRYVLCWLQQVLRAYDNPATACYLNDRLSLDGRDPNTYGNIAAVFAGALSNRERPVYGRVPTRGDGSTRRRDGGETWLSTAASRAVPYVSIPTDVPVDPYLTGEPTS